MPDHGAGPARRRARRVVALGTALAWAGTAHACVNARRLRRVEPADTPPRRVTVSLLVPARDEAERIEACLRSLSTQNRVEVAEILVLDDGSTDDTARRAAGVPDPRIRVLSGTALPAGRLGKPHACRQLAAAARGEVLVFVDADVRLHPGAVAGALALQQRTRAALVSPFPRQLAVSLPERLVQPTLQWSILTFLPLRRAERSPRPSLVAANGQFLVVERAAYERCGGHRDEVLDDLALARAVKRSGGRVVLCDGSRVAECRMYEDWPSLRAGYTKSLWSAFGGTGGAAGVGSLLLLAYVVPPLAMLRGSALGALGYLGAVCGRVVTARATGGRSADAAAHPVSVALLTALTARSVVDRRRGRLQWRGRPVG